MSSISTIGYEGTSIADFLATLRLVDVQVLIDIRELPLSRKRGFSKKSLSEALEGEGIQYVHLRDLGDPKPGRDAAKRGDMPEFERIFHAHMKGDKAQIALESALEVASRCHVCLLCFERDHSCCHRRIVADAMAERKAVNIRHLGVRSGLAEEQSNGKIEHAPVYALG